MRFIARFLCRCGLVLACVALVPLLFVAGCQSSLLYYPRPYAPGQAASWAEATPGKLIEFQTSQGRQLAFLQGNLTSPRNLWLVGCGNATLVLEWSHFLGRHGSAEDAWLLMDLPGYGDSEGSPNPKAVLESWRAVLPLAQRELGMPVEPGRLRIFGHSLGAATCLIAASEFGIQKGVLLSPFTSTMEMSKVLTGLPLGFLVRHRYDNIVRIDELADRGAGSLILIHGTLDSIIPVGMSRHLASLHPEHVILREAPEGGHNDLSVRYADLIAEALREAGEPGL